MNELEYLGKEKDNTIQSKLGGQPCFLIVPRYSTESSRECSSLEWSHRGYSSWEWWDSPSSPATAPVPSIGLSSALSSQLDAIFLWPRAKNLRYALDPRMTLTRKYPLRPIFLKTFLDLRFQDRSGWTCCWIYLKIKEHLLVKDEMLHLDNSRKIGERKIDLGYSMTSGPEESLHLEISSERIPSRLPRWRRTSSTPWRCWDTPWSQSCLASPWSKAT